MPRTTYDEIIATDERGPNRNRSKSEKLRRFCIPSKYTVPGSQDKGKRTLTIYLAIISDSYVFVLEDNARIARMWWKSRTQIWLSHEITVDSQVSPMLYIPLLQFIYISSDLGIERI
jgi:hypothetical protein